METLIWLCGIAGVVSAIALFVCHLDIERDKPGDFGPVEHGPFDEPERVKL